ncbi:hypothetical protein ACROYT_G038507 [Oculina patagonica]
MSCSHSCLRNAWCTSTNFKKPSGINGKGTCELNKHGTIDLHTLTASVMSTKFHEQQGVTFSILLKGCLMTGCLNGGSCVPDEKKQTFSCSCKVPWIGEQCATKIENWQKINTEPVCFGARGNQYGAFNITKSGRLKTIKLIHKSGSIKCNPVDSASYWGCRYSGSYGNNGLLTIITNANKEAVLPPAGDLKAASQCDNKKHFYSLDGTNHTSSELVFPDLSIPLSVSCNQELQIWYGQDWVDCSEDNNSGTTCVDVYAWYT